MSKELVIFGGGGYCGGRLVPHFLALGFKVRVFDTFWFGRDHLAPHQNLSLVSGDIRNIDAVRGVLSGASLVLHLACISNDSSFELDEGLSTSVNFESFEPVVIAAKEAGVKRFVFASSSSVYGVSESPTVDETHPLVPLTLYNKYKGLCEPLLLKHCDDGFEGVVFRPATVCGYSPRQRLDLSVNILTNHAVNKGKITVFGGAQLRPNLHIDDYVELCELLLNADKNLVHKEIFNCGYENMSIAHIAELVKERVETRFPDREPIDIEYTESDDMRSYHIDSSKIQNVLGFKPSRSIAQAIDELCDAFIGGDIPDSFDDRYFNVKVLKKIHG